MEALLGKSGFSEFQILFINTKTLKLHQNYKSPYIKYNHTKCIMFLFHRGKVHQISKLI